MMYKLCYKNYDDSLYLLEYSLVTYTEPTLSMSKEAFEKRSWEVYAYERCINMILDALIYDPIDVLETYLYDIDSYIEILKQKNKMNSLRKLYYIRNTILDLKRKMFERRKI